MNRISHILAVVDPSTKGRQAAVEKAAHLARCSNAAVELLICEIASALNDQAPPGARRPHPDNTELLDMLESLAGPLRAQGTTVSLRIIYGKSLPDTLLDYLRGSNADLVIKDTHQQSFARRTFARNTDWHLVRGCSMPLLLTKKKSWSQPAAAGHGGRIAAERRQCCRCRIIASWNSPQPCRAILRAICTSCTPTFRLRSPPLCGAAGKAVARLFRGLAGREFVQILPD